MCVPKYNLIPIWWCCRVVLACTSYSTDLRSRQKSYPSHFNMFFIRAVLKNGYDSMSRYLFLWYLYCIVIHNVMWSPFQNTEFKFNDTKEHLCTLFSYLRLQCVHCVIVSSWRARVHLNFIFHFDISAAMWVCLVVFQHHSNTLERKFWIKLFWLKDNPDHTQQLVFSSVFTF